jgi:pimeloyl-ACP methyl ester carboxylesterase
VSGVAARRALGLTAVALTCAALCAPAQAAGGERLRVGALVLHRCGAGKSGWCGSLPRPLDPARPAGPKIAIGLRWLPASDRARRPTLVTVEGGPGYPSIGSLFEYQAMFGPLRRDRDMLLVDNRGTGSSALIDCPRLQAFAGVTSGPAFPGIVAGCARQLARDYRGVPAADLLATAYAAADLDAVLRALRIGSIDLYGDSYGTYFAQSFVSRYRDRLHSVILDSAYPVRGLDPWYASSGRVAREALDAVCVRDPGCAAAAPGSATTRLAALLDVVRAAPLTGIARNADTSRVAARVDPRTLVDMVQDAASDPVILRELDASVRAALAGDPVPLLRLAAQSNTFNHGASSAAYFSNGLYMAVSCTDYPQLFSLAASPAQRRRQLATTVGHPPPGDPFAPFTVAEWLAMSAYSEPYAACLDWPAPRHVEPAVPAKAPPPLPASVPLLVIGGDLDSLTPLSDARELAPKLARKVRVVALRNTVHVTSEGDTFLSDGARCARRILRRFLRAPRRLAALDTRCAARIATIHTPGAYPLDFADAGEATVVSGPDPGAVTRRAVTVAAGALADAIIRRYYSGANRGPGLRGGTFTATGDAVVRLGLTAVRFVRDATVDGRGSWDPSDGGVFGSVTVGAPDGTRVTVRLDWTQRDRMARAQVGATRLELAAP